MHHLASVAITCLGSCQFLLPATGIQLTIIQYTSRQVNTTVVLVHCNTLKTRQCQDHNQLIQLTIVQSYNYLPEVIHALTFVLQTNDHTSQYHNLTTTNTTTIHDNLKAATYQCTSTIDTNQYSTTIIIKIACKSKSTSRCTHDFPTV